MLSLSFSLNGSSARCVAPADRRLTQILRDDFGLTSARMACGIGRCGACLVLWNGRPANGCLLMAWQLDGGEIITAEGLDAIAPARIVKAALAQENAFQCGYCAPGFVVALTALLRERPGVSEPEMRRALVGNLCRCTGYHSILRGAMRAAALLAQQSQHQQQSQLEQQGEVQ
jgi:carbon-monoxide dehydrogenase small subunit